MSIARLLRINLALVLVLALTSAALVVRQLDFQREISESQQELTDLNFIIAAVQWMDAESRVAMSVFVSTEDPKYLALLESYDGVLSGKSPWLNGKTVAYWDEFTRLLSSDNMKNYDILIDMFTPVDQAYRVQGLRAAQGLYLDANGDYTIRGEPDFEKARELIFNPKYISTYQKAQTYFKQMYEIAVAETGAKVREATENMQRSIYIVLSLLILFCVTSFMIFLVMRNKVLRPVQNMVNLTKQLSRGDLTVSAPDQGKDEVSEFGRAFNKMVSDFAVVFGDMATSSECLTQSSGSLTGRMSSMGVALDQQQNETGQVSSAITEMVASSEEVAGNCMSAASRAAESSELALEGQGIAEQAMTAMAELSSSINGSREAIGQLENNAEQVSCVLGVIREIADQTNLLALNAAIEAARAGDQGRGFAVVADEVRTLAQRTQNSTNEIQTTLEQLLAGVAQVVAQMENSSERSDMVAGQIEKTRLALDNIATGVNDISQFNHQIAVAAEEQTNVAETIAILVEQINVYSVGSVELSRQSLEDVLALDQLADSLRNTVDNVQLS